MDILTQLEDIDLKIEQWIWNPHEGQPPILNLRIVYDGVPYQTRMHIHKDGLVVPIGDLITRLIKQIPFKYENHNTEKP